MRKQLLANPVREKLPDKISQLGMMCEEVQKFMGSEQPDDAPVVEACHQALQLGEKTMAVLAGFNVYVA